MKKINDRIGEEGYNKRGNKIIITKYNSWDDVNIYFPKYNWTAFNKRYSRFKDGSVNCPYEPTLFDVGFIGEGEHPICENGKMTRAYNYWANMLKRCYYNDEYDSKTAKEWLNFQNFAQWDKENYYNIPNERICLDKDILYKGNKIYSPSTCIYVPNRINVMFTNCKKARGNYPVGVYKDKKRNIYSASLNKMGIREYLGAYSTYEEAFEVYKYHKEKYMKEVIDSYEGKIPTHQYEKLHKAIYNWKIEIID